MIELAIMIGIIGWFARTAKEKNRNKALWGIIGAASYYLTIIIFGWIIFPITIYSWFHVELKFIMVLINIAIGVIGVLIARNILKNKTVIEN